MFFSCESLLKLDFSNFNTSSVTNMEWIFYNCFTEKQPPSTLICKASTIKKITDKEDKKAVINNIIENKDNQEKVYICSVERVEIKPQIIVNIKTHITIVECQITAVVEYKEVEKVK